MMRRAWRRSGRDGIPWLGALAVAMLLAGCFNPFRPRVAGSGISVPPPVPNSPSNVLHVLEWCYNNRNPFLYREIFTDNYRFWFAVADPAGNAYYDVPWTREDELESTTKLFLGGDANQPAATSINLYLDRNFGVFNDPRDGKVGRWHKKIRTTVALSIVIEGNQSNVTGSANFYLTRGDSAVIPQELLERGFLPDSNRWYIDTWEDETTVPSSASEGRSVPAPETAGRRAQPAGAATLPSRLSWGGLKVIYRR